MRKIKYFLGYLIAYLFSFSLSFADNLLLTNPIKATNLNAFFQSLISVCIEMGTIIAALSIMYGGFLYVTAQGDEEKIGKAYKTLTWSLVGTGVLLGARVIMTAIQGTINQLQ